MYKFSRASLNETMTLGLMSRSGRELISVSVQSSAGAEETDGQ